MSEQSASVKQKTAPASSSGDQTVKKLNVPNPIIIIVAIILFSAIASYIIPAGTYTRVEDPNTGNMVVDPESFTYVEQSPVGLFDLFMSVSQGIQDSSSIIAFLFIIGGAFGIMEETGAIRTGMGTLVRKMRGREVLP